MNWLEYTPSLEERTQLSTLVEAGFTPRMLEVSKHDVVHTSTWAAVDDWWQHLDTHLQVPRGLSVWSHEPQALNSLCLVAIRLSFWRHLPVGRGMRVLPVQVVEAADLGDDEVFNASRSAGTLLVVGVGALTYGVDRTIELLSSLASIRSRAGCLTLWHLDPAPTARSIAVCTRLVDMLGDTTIRIGTTPTLDGFGGAA